jgi:hypothetical protein
MYAVTSAADQASGGRAVRAAWAALTGVTDKVALSDAGERTAVAGDVIDQILPLRKRLPDPGEKAWPDQP